MEKEKKNKDGRKEKNLDFLRQVINALHLSDTQFANMAGISQQTFSYWFITDDALLSSVMKGFENLGLKLECNLDVQNNEEYCHSTDRYMLQMTGLESVIEQPKPRMSIMQEAIIQNKRMKFLGIVVQELGLDLKNFSETIGIKYVTMYAWFKRDDIKISKIYDIAEKLDRKVSWNITAIEKNDD